MNTEELKLIIEAVEGVSGDAKHVLLLYFAKDIIGSLIGCLGASMIVIIVAKAIHQIVKTTSNTSRVCDELASKAGFDFNPLYDSHVKRLIDWIRKHD